MKWSKEAPTIPGYYWYKYNDEELQKSGECYSIVEVQHDSHNDEWFGGECGWEYGLLSKFDGWWGDKIDEPKNEMV